VFFLTVSGSLMHFNSLFALIVGDADKSLARPGRKQPRATEDFNIHISYL